MKEEGGIEIKNGSEGGNMLNSIFLIFILILMFM